VNGLGWLMYAWALGGGHQDGCGTTAATMVKKCVWRLVFCVLFYVDAITIVVENRQRSIINDNSL
jgi:hypothetical protein